MHIGVKVPNWGPLAGPAAIGDIAAAAERAGFGSVWVSDHIAMPGKADAPYPYNDDGSLPFDPSVAFGEPLTTLAWVGGRTERVQLGTGVLVAPLRHPFFLAKQAATLDDLTGGRLLLGLGVGWLAEEFDLLDQEFAARGRTTDDTIGVLRACWRNGEDLPGRYGRMGPIRMAPKPARERGVPILVGGHSPAALRRAVRSGDGWYATKIGPAGFGERAKELRAEAERGGRDPAGLELGIKPPATDPSAVGGLVAAYEDAGATFVILDFAYATAGTDEVLDELARTAEAVELGRHEQRPVGRRAVHA